MELFVQKQVSPKTRFRLGAKYASATSKYSRYFNENVANFSNINKRTTCVDPRIAYAMNRKKRAVMKFDGSSSAMTVLRGRDMRGKTALITGGNSGIGTFNICCDFFGEVS